MGLENLVKVFSDVGVKAEEAASAFNDFASHIPPYTEENILRIKSNPSLSPVAKIRIIRNMKKQMKGDL